MPKGEKSTRTVKSKGSVIRAKTLKKSKPSFGTEESGSSVYNSDEMDESDYISEPEIDMNLYLKVEEFNNFRGFVFNK